MTDDEQREIDALRDENDRLLAQAEQSQERLARLEAARGIVAESRAGAKLTWLIWFVLVAAGVAFAGGMFVAARAVLAARGMSSAQAGDSASSTNAAVGKFLAGLPTSTASGQMIASGPSLGGSWTFVPGGCSSGQRLEFHGVDIRDRNDPNHILRVVDDAVRGPSVSVNRPGSTKGWRFEPPECRELKVEIRPTHQTVNRVRLLDGMVSLDCTLQDGTTFAGTIQFSGCD